MAVAANACLFVKRKSVFTNDVASRPITKNDRSERRKVCKFFK